MKWSWDKFGYDVPREPLRDSELILASLNLASEQGARIQFFPDLGRAIVTSRTRATLTRSDLIKACYESDWDVEYYMEEDLTAIMRLAAVELTRIARIDSESASSLIQNGIFSLYDVSLLSPERLAAIVKVEISIADAIIDCADQIITTEEEAK